MCNIKQSIPCWGDRETAKLYGHARNSEKGKERKKLAVKSSEDRGEHMEESKNSPGSRVAFLKLWLQRISLSHAHTHIQTHTR